MEDYGLRAFRDSGGAIERKRNGVNSWMERLYIAALLYNPYIPSLLSGIRFGFFAN